MAAALAAGGVATATSQPVTARNGNRWKTAAFRQPAAINSSLRRKTGLAPNSVAWAVNIRAPVSAISPRPAPAHGSKCRARAATGTPRDTEQAQVEHRRGADEQRD